MSGNSVNRLIYWDACIYLAWLKKEVHGPEIDGGIAEAADDNWEGKLTIVTSTITYVEVLASSLSEEQEKLFRRSFKALHHVARDVDPPVAMKAHAFRNAFYGSPRCLSTPDAIHLATAVLYKAGEFWTMDDGGKGKSIGLLELDQDKRIDQLAVKAPYARRPTLGLHISPTLSRLPETN